jgi:hypothetical protein
MSKFNQKIDTFRSNVDVIDEFIRELESEDKNFDTLEDRITYTDKLERCKRGSNDERGSDYFSVVCDLVYS